VIEESPHLVLIGRHEEATVDTELVRAFTDPYRAQAERAWRERWPDRIDAWNDWHVQAMIGSFGAWTYVDFLRYDGFGRSYTPVLVERLRFVPRLGLIDPYTVTAPDPPILHGSWRLLPEGGLPEKGRGWRDRSSRREHLRSIDRKLRRLGAFDHPDAGTRDGWKRVLTHYRVQVREDANGGRFRLESLDEKVAGAV
jgi:hypothetical protein